VLGEFHPAFLPFLVFWLWVGTRLPSSPETFSPSLVPCPRKLLPNPFLPLIGYSPYSLITPTDKMESRCEDLYNPKSSKHASIDGAYFGTSFHSMLFQVYPALIPTKSRRRYEPKIFGFKVHAAAALGRWQDEFRRSERLKLVEAGVGIVDVPATGDAGGRTGVANTAEEEVPTTKIQKLYVEDEESDDGMGEVEEEAKERTRVAERRAAALAAMVAANKDRMEKNAAEAEGATAG
jgi:hypothetical protein